MLPVSLLHPHPAKYLSSLWSDHSLRCKSCTILSLLSFCWKTADVQLIGKHFNKQYAFMFCGQTAKSGSAVVLQPNPFQGLVSFPRSSCVCVCLTSQKLKGGRHGKSGGQGLHSPGEGLEVATQLFDCFLNSWFFQTCDCTCKHFMFCVLFKIWVKLQKPD